MDEKKEQQVHEPRNTERNIAGYGNAVFLRHITSNLLSAKFTVMVDETSDVSTIEQVVLVFRWVDSSLEAHEDFFGVYETGSATLDSLVHIIKDAMLQFNLKLENCRLQWC